jgi:transcriptional regulator with XRE-family HTH domain
MRLKRWRQEMGLDARELAEQIGVTPSWVSKIERGRGRPKPSLAKRIAKALGKPYLEVWRAVNEDFEACERAGEKGRE